MSTLGTHFKNVDSNTQNFVALIDLKKTFCFNQQNKLENQHRPFPIANIYIGKGKSVFRAILIKHHNEAKQKETENAGRVSILSQNFIQWSEVKAAKCLFFQKVDSSSSGTSTLANHACQRGFCF